MSNKTKRTALRFSVLTAIMGLSVVLLSGCMPAEGGEGGGGLATMLPLIIIIAVFYFIMIRPQQKKTKQVNEMRSAIKPGDYITTIGGFRGRVVRVKDEVVTIQIGTDKVKLEIMKWGISKIEESAPERTSSSRKPKPAAEREAELEEQKKKPNKLTKPVKKEEPVDEPDDIDEDDDEE